MAEVVSKRSIVYEILLDFQKGKTDVKEAEKAIEEFTKDVNGAATSVERFAKNTETSVGKLRQLKQQINNFKGSQKEFEALTLEAARLQDQINKTNQRIRTLASSTRQIEALASGVQGLVGVFTAAQGAVALFGDENKDLQKAILRVQGALALLQGTQAAIATVTEQSAFKTIFLTNVQKAYNFVIGTSTGLLKAFRLALATAGFGIAIIALGELAKVMGLFGDRTKAATEALEAYRKKLQETEKAIVENARLTREAADNSISAVERQIKFARESGATQEQLFLLEQFLREKQLKELQTQLADQQKLREKGVDIQYSVFVDLENKIKDKQVEILTAQKKFLSDQNKLFLEEQAKRQRQLEQRGGTLITVGQLTALPIDQQAAFEAEEIRKRMQEAENQRLGLIVKTAEVQGTAHEQLMNDLREEEEQRARLMQVVQQSAIIFNNLAQLARDNSDAQLGLSIASVIAANAEALAKGVASAAAIPFPGNLPAIFSTIATITGVFASIKNLSEQAKAAQASTRVQTAQRFAEGTPYLEDTSAPRGKDTIPIYANRGEAIIPTEENLKAPGLAAAWINGNLEDYINVNYVSPALAAKTIEEIERDSALDYSNRFYKQLLATAEGNQINKKALKYLNSIDVKMGKNIPSRYA